MQTRTFALVLGIILLVVGIAGFIPGLLTPAGGPLDVNAFHGLLFGLFPVNILHNLFHIAFGIWGIVAYRGLAASRVFAQATAVVYAVLVVLGLFPGLNTLFGILPLHGHNIWLHALIAIAAAYFGFFRRVSPPAPQTEYSTARR